ncbi:acyl-CoA thioesterase [Rhizobium bangladeshense]|uniref:acyl-CoA thioesterase n=1 Tax=Rhizobium bangladeshense TaxID=1138189 RepID=UPI001A99DA4C|nr:thioesterase family protein [Rhizobium bangladeshense]MBX4891309.1 acyl-CoA thioesterase [Rhizobium bangladeshense]MBX4934299.1 acyl-CoA thioesterase [Rhizobium bangladeshense]MBY3582917.1 acyl-CoA thioesterase [Rhizobium bangladeshense]MBY3595485.1 acyl-CoA thioesterase [Rhizobium bangladeshense]QSY91247.1 acyl-CoA thioesterase [Rhizobium bangladeshense]
MRVDDRPLASFRVSMRDIDIYGHVHNSVYLDYCEDAVVELLRHRGILSHFRHTSSGVAYHVKKAEITFHNPVDVDDVVEPKVDVAKIGRSSLSFAIELYRRRDGAHCASAGLVWVCVGLSDSRPTPIPEATRAALTPG